MVTYLISIKKKDNTEWSESETEKQIPYANTYIWNLKKKKII